eukprot:m.113951 g.113951  ORF g.113951 m.113951 type:complete len:97 (+) comp12806_c1_seq1:614-904(+)
MFLCYSYPTPKQLDVGSLERNIFCIDGVLPLPSLKSKCVVDDKVDAVDVFGWLRWCLSFGLCFPACIIDTRSCKDLFSKLLLGCLSFVGIVVVINP